MQGESDSNSRAGSGPWSPRPLFQEVPAARPEGLARRWRAHSSQASGDCPVFSRCPPGPSFSFPAILCPLQGHPEPHSPSTRGCSPALLPTRPLQDQELLPSGSFLQSREGSGNAVGTVGTEEEFYWSLVPCKKRRYAYVSGKCQRFKSPGPGESLEEPQQLQGQGVGLGKLPWEPEGVHWGSFVGPGAGLV